jgi:curved DNA-binding protein
MKYKDYYAVLGVAKDAELEQIKKAYRKLARTHHPDLSKQSDAEAQFKEIAEAYNTLKNPEKRQAYDALGRVHPGGNFTPPPTWQDQYQDAPFAFDQMDLSDLLDSLSKRTSRSYQSTQAMAGQDMENTVDISLKDALLGTTVRFKVIELGQEKELEVSIPAGVNMGKKLRLKGLGSKGLNGGANGDLYLHIKLRPHPLFKPLGQDLFFNLALAPWEAVLGAEIEVPTLEDPLILSVPANTRNGQKLRLKSRGLGVPMGARGDLFAVVHIETPNHPSAQETSLYEQLAKLSSSNPRTKSSKESHHDTAHH